ncbi:MAG: hypothetical protein KAX49_20545 [Halanaerobiales bacterium]|nr:hypothetical protein [Halanaerobiales bacterium]
MIRKICIHITKPGTEVVIPDDSRIRVDGFGTYQMIFNSSSGRWKASMNM